MKNKILINVLIFFLLFLSSCAIAPKPVSYHDKLNLLNQELENWKTFKITGLCDLEYQSFAIRRPCVIAKTQDKFRFDILDTGLLGLGGGVLMALYADNKQIQFRKPGSSKIDTRILDDEMNNWLSIISEGLIQSIHEQKDKIIETNICEIDGSIILFTPRMKIKEINNPDKEIKITFKYDNQEKLSEISISIPLIRNLTIHIDKIDYNDIIVSPLK